MKFLRILIFTLLATSTLSQAANILKEPGTPDQLLVWSAHLPDHPWAPYAVPVVYFTTDPDDESAVVESHECDADDVMLALYASTGTYHIWLEYQIPTWTGIPVTIWEGEKYEIFILQGHLELNGTLSLRPTGTPHEGLGWTGGVWGHENFSTVLYNGGVGFVEYKDFNGRWKPHHWTYFNGGHPFEALPSTYTRGGIVWVPMEDSGWAETQYRITETQDPFEDHISELHWSYLHYVEPDYDY